MKIEILKRPEHKNDLEKIRGVLLDRGYETSLSECENLWELYSDSMCAGWMGLPEKDEEIFWAVKSFIVEATS